MSDDSALRTCGLWNFYRANRAEFDKFASSIYAALCDLRQAAQRSGAGMVVPPTLAECQDFCEKSIDRFPYYGRLRIKPSLNSSECYTALARYLIRNSWNTVSQNPCI